MDDLKLQTEGMEKRQEEYRSGKRCHMCGQLTISVRGRYPKDPERLVCATCLRELMDQIRELTDPSYGIPQQAKE